ncbi:MAG: hypothetical protein HN337_09035 [Deltaproteobacteria bacterium]|nr:hypothetical protein [Deltaproteobacteria bacterium]
MKRIITLFATIAISIFFNMCGGGGGSSAANTQFSDGTKIILGVGK